jgi:hypothetical protein
MRRTVATVAVTAALAASTLLGAAPANASGHTIYGCTGGTTLYLLPIGSTLTVLTPGGYTGGTPVDDQCYFGKTDTKGNATTTHNADQTQTYLTVFDDESAAMTSTRSLTVRTTMSEIVSCDYFDLAALRETAQREGFTIVSMCDEADNSPRPALQQVPPAADGTCADSGAALNWSGVAGTGWTKSWAEWINGGTGGNVCTRTLRYSSALAGWTIGA